MVWHVGRWQQQAVMALPNIALWCARAPRRTVPRYESPRPAVRV